MGLVLCSFFWVLVCSYHVHLVSVQTRLLGLLSLETDLQNLDFFEKPNTLTSSAMSNLAGFDAEGDRAVVVVVLEQWHSDGVTK